jgi:cytochrome c
MKLARSAIALFPAVLLASFLLGYVHPFGGVGLSKGNALPTETGDGTMPPPVRAVLAAKCGDCHSLETRWPVYAHLAPGSWLIERDVVKARAAMNLSQWDSFPADRQEDFKAKIAHEIHRDEMPPAQYLALHWNARLTPDDIRAIGLWAEERAAESDRPVAAGPALPPGDANRGKVVFDKRCTGCHAMNQDREGPHLAGVYGRAAATVNGFDYSEGLKKSHIVWNEDTLDRWLTDPQTMVPGAAMDFYVAKPGERADVIAYLKQQSGK